MKESDSPQGFQRCRLPPLASNGVIMFDDNIKKNLIPLQKNLKKKKAQTLYYSKGTSPLLRDEVKAPVHMRLGKRKPKVQILGTNTNYLLTKKSHNQQHFSKSTKFSAQPRIQKIREKHNKALLALYTNKALKNIKHSNASNLSVQFWNNVPFNNVQRFKLQLNREIQEEIRTIQANNQRGLFYGIHPILPNTTALTTNDRFGLLS